MTADLDQWWRTGTIYEIYIRSFADGNGDGLGDLVGIREKLPYLADLGIDALWITPWYPSPMADGGYDVADYRDIDPRFGDLSTARALIADAHAHGLRVIADFVANHTSDQHPWFQAALRSATGTPARQRYHFQAGRGAGGNEPPNDWISAFGGPAWTRTANADGTPGEWYLHLFSPAQPDLNWEDASVRSEFADIIRYWFDLGLDGLRVDAAAAFVKAPGLPDFGFSADGLFEPVNWTGSPLWDVEGVHQLFRNWRAIADEYEGRVFVGEVIVNGADRLARYMRPDELHTTFNLDFLKRRYEANDLRDSISATLAAFDTVDAPPTWTLSSHDETRHLTRYGREETSGHHNPWPFPPTDLALGRRRARAMLLLMLALPGAVYLYQGEELGLPEVEDLPDEAIQDPIWSSSQGRARGRDGCRVPIPWTMDPPAYGFTTGTPWLPQPDAWSALSVERQQGDNTSMLEFYRTALHKRRQFADTGFVWVTGPDDVLVFNRGPVQCIVNFSATPILVCGKLLVASHTMTNNLLEPDTAAWVQAT